MFKYICMPKLVAFYLREFSVRLNGEPSDLYKFVFCLCLPFVSSTFRRARLIALAIAECTDSADQIRRVFEKITTATVVFHSVSDDYFTPYDGTGEVPDFPYNNSLGNDNPIVPYTNVANLITMDVTLNNTSQSEFESYVPLLIPFYVKVTINYI